MKYLIILLLSITIINAGELIWLDSTNLQSYEYNYGEDHDSVELGVEGKIYTFKFDVLQAMVKSDMRQMLTSPRNVECVKRESCHRGYCSREYGLREENFRLLLIVNKKKKKIKQYRRKRVIGRCE